MKLTRTHLTKPSVAFHAELTQALAAHPRLVLGVGATVAAVGALCASPILPTHVIATAAAHALASIPTDTGGPWLP